MELAKPNPYVIIVDEALAKAQRKETAKAAAKKVVKPKEPAWLTFESTAYVAFCDSGCIGITKTGINVSNTITYAGKQIVAVDPKVIPLGSAVEMKLTSGKVIEATAQDTGGSIKGARIDLLMGTLAEARQFGRQTVKVRIIEK